MKRQKEMIASFVMMLELICFSPCCAFSLSLSNNFFSSNFYFSTSALTSLTFILISTSFTAILISCLFIFKPSSLYCSYMCCSLFVSIYSSNILPLFFIYSPNLFISLIILFCSYNFFYFLNYFCFLLFLILLNLSMALLNMISNYNNNLFYPPSCFLLICPFIIYFFIVFIQIIHFRHQFLVIMLYLFPHFFLILLSLFRYF